MMKKLISSLMITLAFLGCGSTENENLLEDNKQQFQQLRNDPQIHDMPPFTIHPLPLSFTDFALAVPSFAGPRGFVHIQKDRPAQTTKRMDDTGVQYRVTYSFVGGITLINDVPTLIEGQCNGAFQTDTSIIDEINNRLNAVSYLYFTNNVAWSSHESPIMVLDNSVYNIRTLFESGFNICTTLNCNVIDEIQVVELRQYLRNFVTSRADLSSCPTYSVNRVFGPSVITVADGVK